MGLVVHAAEPLGLPVQLAIGLLMVAGLTIALRLMRPRELAMGSLYAQRLRARLVGLVTDAGDTTIRHGLWPATAFVNDPAETLLKTRD